MKEYQAYGEDHGNRILYTKLTFNVLLFKATCEVNKDADEGLYMEDIREWGGA